MKWVRPDMKQGASSGQAIAQSVAYGAMLVAVSCAMGKPTSMGPQSMGQVTVQ